MRPPTPDGEVSLDRNGGFASVRSSAADRGLPGAQACAIAVRGDNKLFMLSLFADDGFDSLNYQAGFAPKGNGWQTLRLPLASLRAGFRGRELPNAPALDPAWIHQVGLMIAAQQAGPFARPSGAGPGPLIRPTTACRARQLPLDHPKLQRMKRMNAPTPQKDLGRSQPETDLPGGRDLNHAASVATSAALGAAAAGALAGSIAGPIGTAVGAAAGAVAAGIAGNQIANEIDAKAEEAHWRDNFRKQPYVDQDAAFDDYGPAYGYGVLAVIQYPGHPFEAVEAQLSDRWENARGTSTLDWDRARPASRDAWERASRRGPR